VARTIMMQKKHRKITANLSRAARMVVASE
jgi:hypothetical protein